MQRPVLPRRLAYATVIYGLTMLVATGTVPLGLWTAYAREFHFSAAVITFLASSTLFGVLVAVLLFGNLSDRIGRRAVLIPGVLLGALSMVLFIFADGVPALFAARVASGLAVGLFTGAGTAALTELVPPGRRHAPRRHARCHDLGRGVRDGPADRRGVRAVRAVSAPARRTSSRSCSCSPC